MTPTVVIDPWVVQEPVAPLVEVWVNIKYAHPASKILINRAASLFVRGIFTPVCCGVSSSAEQTSRQGLERKALS